MPSAWALSSRPLSYLLPYCKEGLVTFCYAPGLILCATRLSVLIFCYIRLASRLCVPLDRLTAHTGHPRYLDT